MSNGHGGSRPGAGRPKTNSKHLVPIAAAMDVIAQHLDPLIRAHIKLALGGYTITDTKLQLACTLKAIPEGASPGDMVVVEERTRTAEPNGAALASLLDRIAGRPVQQIDLSVLDEANTTLPAELVSRYRQVAADYARELLAAQPGGVAGAQPSRN